MDRVGEECTLVHGTQAFDGRHEGHDEHDHGEDLDSRAHHPHHEQVHGDGFDWALGNFPGFL